MANSNDAAAATGTLVPFQRPNTETALGDPGTSTSDQEDGERWSTGERVLAGVGIAAGFGLGGFGLFKLGEHLGWWGSSEGGIVIDDPKDDGKDGGGSDPDEKSDGGSGGGGGRKSQRAIGHPPNMSGDPEGYNSKLFPSPLAVRVALKALGYKKIELESDPLVGEDETFGEVRRFQKDWNAVIKAIDAGRVKLPSSPKYPKQLSMYRGLLDADDVPGKYTLRAVEIAARNKVLNGIPFGELRKAAGR